MPFQNLKDYLIHHIKNHSPLSIKQYMQECLANPEFGYYTTKNPFHQNKDFITAPEISSIFGDIIGSFLAYHLIINNLNKISLIEIGSGSGKLMRDILHIFKKLNLINKLNIFIVDINPELIKTQKQNLSEFPNITWVNDINSINTNTPTFIFANEFLDALPINQFIFSHHSWHQLDINADQYNNLFLDIGKPIQNPQISLKQRPQNGDIFEFSQDITNYIIKIANLINKNSGLALFIDYGYIQKQFSSTLQSIYKNKMVHFLQMPGESDITAHVDFTNIKNTAQQNALLTTSIENQKTFMLKLGIKERLESSIKSNPSNKDKLIQSVNRIIDNKQMGDLFKTICLYKKVNIEWIQ